MKKLPTLKPRDRVEIISPASRSTDKRIAGLKELFRAWELDYVIADDIFGNDLLCSNTDAARFEHLKNALLNPENKAVICASGGYGSMRLIPELAKIAPPTAAKLFVGMSDTTALHIFLQQQWQWPTLHGAPAADRFSPESIAAIKTVLFGEVKQVEFAELTPLNKAAEMDHIIEATITGGNLCLVQSGIGTLWQLDARDKIILLEDVDERAYRVDRMLEHLRQANIFKHAAAILFADFIEGKEPNGMSLIEPVLNRFAESCDIPVARVKNIGHGFINYPVPLGTPATLRLGSKIKLTCVI